MKKEEFMRLMEIVKKYMRENDEISRELYELFKKHRSCDFIKSISFLDVTTNRNIFYDILNYIKERLGEQSEDWIDWFIYDLEWGDCAGDECTCKTIGDLWDLIYSESLNHLHELTIITRNNITYKVFDVSKRESKCYKLIWDEDKEYIKEKYFPDMNSVWEYIMKSNNEI